MAIKGEEKNNILQQSEPDYIGVVTKWREAREARLGQGSQTAEPTASDSNPEEKLSRKEDEDKLDSIRKKIKGEPKTVEDAAVLEPTEGSEEREFIPGEIITQRDSGKEFFIESMDRDANRVRLAPTEGKVKHIITLNLKDLEKKLATPGSAWHVKEI